MDVFGFGVASICTCIMLSCSIIIDLLQVALELYSELCAYVLCQQISYYHAVNRGESMSSQALYSNINHHYYNRLP